MKVVTLLENTSCRENITAEHGLSLYLETGGYKILFDMGQSDAFASNAEKMGIDLSRVDFAVLSHGHYDHGGGLITFLNINPHAPVYVHERAFDAHYNGKEKYIGLPKSLWGNSRLIIGAGSRCLAPGIELQDCNDLGWQFDSWGLNRREGEVYSPDPFRHERYLLITEGTKRILLSGCSHKGIVNIAEYFQPDVLIGGFHLSKQEDSAVLRDTARRLMAGNTVYFTGHCTGSGQFAIMKEIMGERLQSVSAGYMFEV